MEAHSHIRKRISDGRGPHALILTGDLGADTAKNLAAAYVCQAGEVPCGDCRHCRKAKAGIHPDILHFGGEGDDLKIDRLRELRSDAYIMPNEARRKVYLIEGAHRMNPYGQNVLLKLLEEGPAYAVFLLLAANPEALLPTLRSRCEMLRCEAVSQLVHRGAEAERFAGLLCTEGLDSLGLAHSCIGLEKKSREEFIAFLDEVQEILVQQLPQNPRRMLPRVDAVRAIRGHLDFNISSGHVAGLLLAQLTEETALA